MPDAYASKYAFPEYAGPRLGFLPSWRFRGDFVTVSSLLSAAVVSFIRFLLVRWFRFRSVRWFRVLILRFPRRL